MGSAEGRHLRKMRNRDDLARHGKTTKAPTDRIRNAPGRAGVRFVEDQGVRASLPRPGRFERQEKTRGLATRCNLADGSGHHLGTGAEEKMDAVQPVLREVLRARVHFPFRSSP